MKRLLLLTCLILLAASVASAAWIDESFESGEGVFYSEYPGLTTIVADPTAPHGDYVVQMEFPEGFTAGNAPDVFISWFDIQSEIYSSFYFKISDGFVYDAYEQKLVFYWGNDFNFYIGVGRWSDRKLYGCIQGDGTVYENLSGPDIETDTWYHVAVRLNTSGVFQLWLDGTLIISETGVSIPGGFNGMAFTPVYGGMGPPYTVPQDQYIWFDKAWVSSAPDGATGEDVSAPYLSSRSPASGATNVPLSSTTISFHIKDDRASDTGVDNSTIAVSLNGFPLDDLGITPTITGTASDYTVSFVGSTSDWSPLGTYTVGVGAADAEGNWLSTTWSFTAAASETPDNIVITTATAAAGRVSQAYSQTIYWTGGDLSAGVEFSISSGALPTGVVLSQTSDTRPLPQFIGTPTTAATYTPTLQIKTLADNVTATQAYSIIISPALPAGQYAVEIASSGDTWIGGGTAVDNNFSSDTFLEIYQWPQATPANRILLSFDLSSLPSPIRIDYVTLYLYQEGYEGSGGTNPANAYVYKVTNSFNAATVTWNTFDNVIGNYIDYESCSLEDGWRSWNVTEAATAGETMYLLVDHYLDGATDTNRIFTSSEGAEGYRPKVIVGYTLLSSEGGPSISAPGKLRVSGKFRFGK